jgi:2-dehydro-3-deoxyphosphogluconate aldolase/(4S)-4-hydroxy-2-oxoglutarate aldolase
MNESITRTGPSAILRGTPIIAVLRAKDAADYAPIIDTLSENGIRSIELTLSTPNTIELLPELLARTGPLVEIGVGTITNADQAQRAIDAGAAFLVTPVLDQEVIALAVRSRLPVYPGGLTPTELHSAWRAGATAVKIFPAETVGAQYGKHLSGPFPELRFVPSGGVLLDDVAAWLSVGATAVSLGGPLIGDALSGGSLEALAERAARVIEIVRSLRSGT